MWMLSLIPELFLSPYFDTNNPPHEKQLTHQKLLAIQITPNSFNNKSAYFSIV